MGRFSGEDHKEYEIIGNCKVTCRHCMRKTQHEILKEIIEDLNTREDDEENYQGRDSLFWEIIRCLGCQTIAFYSFEDFKDYKGVVWNENIYPDPALNHYPQHAFKRVPNDVLQAYQEVVSAYNSGLHLLGGMGVRMVIEGICNAAGIPGRLQDQIDSLQCQSLLTKAQAQVLHELRKLGNEAAHELFTPTSQQMLTYLKVLESTLETFYELDAHAQTLETERLKRKHDKTIKTV